MSIRAYAFIWLAILVFFSFEYLALNGYHSHSLFRYLEVRQALPFAATPVPGRTLSLWLGWSGLALMVVMNVYSLRKRTEFLKGAGKLASWLNFHVFCGLVGPTFILFHCNFKVRGLVAISFWSMVVSFTSGLVGRYFYLQIVMAKGDLQRDADRWLNRLKRYLKQKASLDWRVEWEPFLDEALVTAGVRDFKPDALSAMGNAFLGDIRMFFTHLEMPEEWPDRTEFALKEYAVLKRRAITLESFQRLMGYWHAFHFPFAVFMYLAAVIHVAASLIFAHNP